jgi:hypothetical protein
MPNYELLMVGANLSLIKETMKNLTHTKRTHTQKRACLIVHYTSKMKNSVTHTQQESCVLITATNIL